MLVKMSRQDETAHHADILLLQHGLNLYILVIMGFETAIDINVFKKLMEQTWIKHPRFSSLLVSKNKWSGSMSWKRVKVDVENHVVVPDLDPNMANPDGFLESYASSLSTNPMDMAKPLWEFHILNVKTSNANSTAILRMHHALGDGVSVISLLRVCSGKPIDSDSLPKFPTKRRKATADIGLMKKTCLWVWTTFLMIFYTLVDCTLMIAAVFIKETKTPLARGIRPSPRRFVQQVLSLDDVKLVKNAMNVTINDVLMGVSEAAISRYLNMRYAEEEKSGNNGAGATKKTNHLPRNLRIRSSVVINLRPSAVIEGLPEVIEKGKELSRMWGNIASFVLVPLTVDQQDDPLMYIRRIKATMERKKLSREAQVSYLVMMVIIKLLGVPKAAAALARKFFNHTTLAFSNVAGPPDQFTLFGHPVCYIAPSVFAFPDLPQPLVFHFMSYAGKLVISTSTRGDSVPNPHQLCHEVVKSLEDMKEAVIKQGLVKRRIETA